jgi:hypothetical protein
MSRQYRNIVQFVAPHGYHLMTTEQEYVDMREKVFIVRCPRLHDMELVIGSFINKKSKFTREQIPMEQFCSVCVGESNKAESEKTFKERIEEVSGHVVLELDNQTRKVVYQCGTCGEKSASFIQNLVHNSGVCHHCQNDKFKLAYEDVKQRVEARGFTLLLKEDEYVNNKQLLPVVCPCSQVQHVVLRGITRGRFCMQCQTARTKATCMERYGETNVSKVPEIFERIVAGLYKRKSFTFPKTGRCVTLMGYEPQAIEYLLSQPDAVLGRMIQEEDIKTGAEIPRFRYQHDGEHVYFPDLMVDKMIVEVKSDYTFGYHPRLNQSKARAVIEQGYVMRFLIFDRKMNVLDKVFRTASDLNDDLFEIN